GQSIRLLGWRGDSLFIATGPIGPTGQRVVVISREGKYVRQWPLPTAFRTADGRGGLGLPPTIAALLPNGSMIGRFLNHDRRVPQWAGAGGESPSIIARLNSEGVVERVVALQSASDCYVKRPSGELFPIPLCQDPPDGV